VELRRQSGCIPKSELEVKIENTVPKNSTPKRLRCKTVEKNLDCAENVNYRWNECFTIGANF